MINMESEQRIENETKSSTIPYSVLESLVDTFLPDIVAFYATEEGRQEYIDWQKEQKGKQQNNR